VKRNRSKKTLLTTAGDGDVELADEHACQQRADHGAQTERADAQLADEEPDRERQEHRQLRVRPERGDEIVPRRSSSARA
jgi:hypothetical protein